MDWATLPVVPVQFQVFDREGKIAVTRLYFPFSSTIDELNLTAADFCSILQDLTDGAVKGYTIRWTYEATDVDSPSIDSDCSVNALLFYRNGDDWEAFAVPSPKPSLWETEGLYAGIRIDMTNMDNVTAIALLSSHIVNTTTPEGSSWPDTYYTGGKAQ